MKNVSFGHNERVIAKDVSLKIERGKFLAITGPSGSGKSTFINLLLRFEDPVSGEIMIDGQNLKDLKFNFREKISICSQSHYFFNDSIINNIRVANLNKFYKVLTDDKCIGTKEKSQEYVSINAEPEQEIVDLIQHFGLSDKIASLPNGYDYIIGDNGNNLSGGERQRLNLIRSLLKDSDIYIFDEPTNFLDSLNKQRFELIVERLLSKGKTVIVVTHDLSIIEEAN